MHSEIPFTPIRRCRRCRLFRPLSHFPWEEKGIFFREQARYCHDCYDFHHEEQADALWAVAKACGLELMALVGVILLASLAGPVWWWLLVPLGVWAAFKAGRYIVRLDAREREENYRRGFEMGQRELRAEIGAEWEARGLPISHAVREFLDGRIKLDDLPEEDSDRMLPVVRAVLKRNGVEA